MEIFQRMNDVKLLHLKMTCRVIGTLSHNGATISTINRSLSASVEFIGQISDFFYKVVVAFQLIAAHESRVDGAKEKRQYGGLI
jgi:hypothetical protein